LEAWRFLEEVVQPDVALLQEAGPPPEGIVNSIRREGGIRDDRLSPPKDRGWGSAVVSWGPSLTAIDETRFPFDPRPIPLLRTFPGSVAIARIDPKEGWPLVVVSAYGVIDQGYADTTVHRILSDLTPLIDRQRAKRIILGGDLNITTQWSAKHRSFLRGFVSECLRRDRNLFDRFETLGLRNVVKGKMALEGCGCEDGSRCEHVRTQWHEKSDFPWQNDYVFVTEDLLPHVSMVRVHDEGPRWELSSHCPIVVELEF
jgi:endonuclease/exonuclease/phosphatase family metal-dependent hydrolase